MPLEESLTADQNLQEESKEPVSSVMSHFMQESAKSDAFGEVKNPYHENSGNARTEPVVQPHAFKPIAYDPADFAEDMADYQSRTKRINISATCITVETLVRILQRTTACLMKVLKTADDLSQSTVRDYIGTAAYFDWAELYLWHAFKANPCDIFYQEMASDRWARLHRLIYDVNFMDKKAYASALQTMINVWHNYHASYLAGLATNSNWESAKSMMYFAVKSDEGAIEYRYLNALHKTDYISMKAAL